MIAFPATESALRNVGIETSLATDAARAPFKVGNFDKGQNRGEISRQWASRPHDQRFLSLDELKAKVAAREQAEAGLFLSDQRRC